MKTITRVLIASLALIAMPLGVAAQTNHNVDGFLYLNAGYSAKTNKVVAIPGRIRATVTPTTTEPWGGRIEIDLTEMQENAKGNWLTQAWASYKAGSDTVVAGRIFVPGNKQTPDLFDLVTARYPASVISPPYAWGLGWAHEFDQHLDLEADLTGATGLSFDDADQFRWLEKHFRLRYKDGADRVSVASKAGPGFSRTGIEGKTDILDGTFTLWAMALHRSERRPLPRPLGGYTLLEWHPLSWLHPHLQREWRSDNTEIWTRGLRFEADRHWRLTIDHNRVEKTEMRLQYTTHF